MAKTTLLRARGVSYPGVYVTELPDKISFALLAVLSYKALERVEGAVEGF